MTLEMSHLCLFSRVFLEGSLKIALQKKKYIYAVELKTGPNFAFYKLKTGHVFCLFLLFIFENLILPAERRGFLKKKQAKTQQKTNL